VAENLSQCHRVVPCRVVPCRRRGGDSTRTRVKDDTEIGKTRSAKDFLDSFRSVAGLRHLFFSLSLSLVLWYRITSANNGQDNEVPRSEWI